MLVYSSAAYPVTKLNPVFYNIVNDARPSCDWHDLPLHHGTMPAT